ncbi:MAG: sodium/sugar symporter [Shewanella sp.]|nr:sodium/sugar symporter [Shewanella sp.]MCF1430484.1 sodium/sugar symporter [Shewanella sp.]MCF1457755.1 sodium/sugar symporter [Shewanella sp.]
MELTTLDLSVVAIYVMALITIAILVSREKAGHEKSANDYFLAGNTLPWWAIGASLIAANISAEQIIGMSGSGYKIGLAIASYEWMAAITLIIVGKYFLPIFLEKKIYTMPQFLEQRFDGRVRLIMAIFWLGVYIFVNLTSVLWLGALAINTIAGVDMLYGMLFLCLFSVAYSLYGGLKAVAFTDIIQVVLLVFGGLFLTVTTLELLGQGNGILAGLDNIFTQAPEKFDMILAKDHPHYIDLPGLSVLIGGMWVMNLSYWGFNQYIIQRTLAAKSLRESQKGIAFAAFLKLLMPVIVVLPGIAAYLLLPELEHPDRAYPELMLLMPEGLRGLIFAAVIAAIVSSVASMTNSIATIFTMDVYSKLGGKEHQPGHLVKVGRTVSLVAMVIALFTAKPLLGNFEQAFQYIQEFTGFFTPGIVVLFLLGMFWKKTTANGGLAAALGSALLSFGFKLFWPELPFMDRVGLVFLLCAALAVAVSLMEQNKVQVKAIELADVDFTSSRGYNLAGFTVALILIVYYTTWW